jgi:hypothetical protein
LSPSRSKPNGTAPTTSPAARLWSTAACVRARHLVELVLGDGDEDAQRQTARGVLASCGSAASSSVVRRVGAEVRCQQLLEVGDLA